MHRLSQTESCLTLLFIYYLCISLYECVCGCLVEVRGPWVLWNCSYKCLWTLMWVLYTLQEQHVLRTTKPSPQCAQANTHTPFLFLSQGFTDWPRTHPPAFAFWVLSSGVCVHWPFIVKSSSCISSDWFKYYLLTCFLVIFILLHLLNEGTHAKGIRGWGCYESWFSIMWIICVLYLV